ncbi:MAG: hypothetical protein LRY76_08980 [Alphaproteobacteria bacterium]|nr:hypothetical protein [Alphaproteobacteria bacterium]MCD8571627.1 hypothetical protein [Alphaproteobacteria bacterium]
MSDHNDDTSNVIKFKKALPKPVPLIPDEEERDENLVKAFNPQGLRPSIDMDDPDVQAAQSEFEAAQKKLQQTIKRKALLKVVNQADSLDPDKVEELCRAEPWKQGPITNIGKNAMGWVPEKFEARAQQYREGSEEYNIFMAARDKAAQIYWDQMKVELKITCAKFEKDPTIKNKRLAYEPLSAALWNFAKTLEPSELWDQQRGRIMWMALNVGEEYMKKHGREKASGPGYQQWAIKPADFEPEPV